jgi:ATP-dependent Lhr-like helicase
MHSERPPDRGVRAGRWSLVHRFGVLGKELALQEVALRQARLLLSRYGVVSRMSLDREEGAWEWASIYRELQRLEMRGEVRRGYFVSGLPGVQFALPEAVERLREGAASPGGSGRRSEAEPGLDDLVVMNAADPANIWGGNLGFSASGRRAPNDGSGAGQPRLGRPVLAFARVPSTWVVLQAGLPLLVAEDTGNRIRTRPGCDEFLLRESLRLLLGHLGAFLQRVHLEVWDGVPVAETGAALMLETLGFYHDQPGMTWDRTSTFGPRERGDREGSRDAGDGDAGKR